MSSIALTPTTATAVNGATVTVAVAGTLTAFTGSPFTISGGTGASIVSQTVTDGLTGSVVINPGTAAAVLTITDTISSTTATVTVSLATSAVAIDTKAVVTSDTNIYTSKTIAASPSTFGLSSTRNASAIRVNWQTKAANSSAVLNGSMDGTNYYALQTLASGINAIVTLCEPYVQIVVTSSSGSTTDVFHVTTKPHA